MAPEKALIEAAQKDKREFIQLYDLHFDRIFKYFMSRVTDQALAEDLTSETFSIALQNIDKYSYTGKPFCAWLFRIAINEMNKHFRKNKRDYKMMVTEWHEMGDRFEAADAGLKKSEEDGIHLENIKGINGALRQLKSTEQDLISLRYFEDLSYKEIAEVMDISVSNVGVKINRALKRLTKLCKLQTS